MRAELEKGLSVLGARCMVEVSTLARAIVLPLVLALALALASFSRGAFTGPIAAK